MGRTPREPQELAGLVGRDSGHAITTVERHQSFPDGHDPRADDVPHRPLGGAHAGPVIVGGGLAGHGRGDRIAAAIERPGHVRCRADRDGTIPPEFEDATEELHLSRPRRGLPAAEAVEDVVVGADPRGRAGKSLAHPYLDANVLDDVEERHEPLEHVSCQEFMQHRHGRVRRLVEREPTAQVGGERPEIVGIDRDHPCSPVE